jgi:hypothetical protein
VPCSPTCPQNWQLRCGTSHMVYLTRSSSATLSSTTALIESTSSPHVPHAPTTPWRTHVPVASSVATSTPATPTTTLTTTSPRTITSTKVAASTTLGYLDIGTRAITSHEHSSASSTVQASAKQLRPRCSRSDCGRVSVHWFLRLRFFSSLTFRDATVVHVTTATTAGGVEDMLGYVLG